MNFLFLVGLAIIVYFLLIISYKFFSKDALFTIAIGSAVASNIFNIGNYPIYVGPFTFGLDSIIYSLFIFCVIIVYLKFSKTDAMNLTYTSMASIMFSGIIQFVASWAVDGISSGVVWGLSSFSISVVATYLAVLLMIWLLDKISSKTTVTFSIAVAILSASIVNSLIYFGLVALISGGFSDNFLSVLSASYIGKIMSIAFAVISYCILDKFKIKKNDTNIINN